MARIIGTISLPEGGFRSGFVGDLPIDEAIAAVQEGRVKFDAYDLRENGDDVAHLLAGLGVASMGELARRLDREQALEKALHLVRPYVATPKKRGDWREEERRKAVLAVLDGALS